MLYGYAETSAVVDDLLMILRRNLKSEVVKVGGEGGNGLLLSCSARRKMVILFMCSRDHVEMFKGCVNVLKGFVKAFRGLCQCVNVFKGWC